MINKTTPLLIYGTRHATVYNLTPSNLPNNLSAVQLCYGDFHDYLDTFANLPEGMTVKKFLGFPQNILTYLTPYDHSKSDCLTGCQKNNKVKIKCNKGYTSIGSDEYDKMIDLIKPDVYVGLTEYPSLEKGHEQISNKSYKRAIVKTKTYLERSKKFNNEHNQPLKLAPVHGGQNLSLIARSLGQVLQHKIDGIIVCDLCEKDTQEEREVVYNTINELLKQEYEREDSDFKDKKLKLALAGTGKLPDIEHAMKFGYEIFEVSYPFILAENHKALIKRNGKLEEHSPQKKQNLLPLDIECTCKACKNHAQSYIAHLIDCYEMTAKVLLSIHNTHVYTEWMKENC